MDEPQAGDADRMGGTEPQPELLVVQAGELKTNGDERLDQPERAEEEDNFQHGGVAGRWSRAGWGSVAGCDLV